MFDSRPAEEWTPISRVSDLHSLSMDGHLYLPAYGGLFGFDHKCGFHPDLIVDYLQGGGYVTINGLRLAYSKAIKVDHAALKAEIERITAPAD